MATWNFDPNWAEAPDSDNWLPLWTQQVTGWQCTRSMKRPDLFALCAAGPHTLLSASPDSLVLTDTQTWRQVGEMTHEVESCVTSLLPLPHAQIVLSGDDDGCLCIWYLPDQKCVRKMHVHDGGVHCLTTVGGHILSGGEDTAIRVWQVPSNVSAEWPCVCVLWDDAAVTAMACGPLGGTPLFFSGLDNGGVTLWQFDGSHWEKEPLPSTHEGTVEAVLRHSLRAMLTIDSWGSAVRWENEDGAWLCSETIDQWKGPHYAVALENVLVAGDAEGKLKIWQKVEEGERVDVVEMSEDESMSESEWETIDEGIQEDGESGAEDMENNGYPDADGEGSKQESGYPG